MHLMYFVYFTTQTFHAFVPGDSVVLGSNAGWQEEQSARGVNIDKTP